MPTALGGMVRNSLDPPRPAGIAPNAATALSLLHPSMEGAMPGSKKDRLPYRVTSSGLLAVTTAVIISLCLFWYGAGSVKAAVMQTMAMEPPQPFVNSNTWAIFVGAPFIGAHLVLRLVRCFETKREER